jgi:hypothetical protein
MYRRPKFLETLIAIREEMAKEADYDVDLFAEVVRSGAVSRPRRSAQAPSEAQDTQTEPNTERPK